MKRAYLIAEKPDLMRKIEAVYNKHKGEIPYYIDFASQRGHLMTLKLPSEINESMKHWSWDQLPFYPEEHGGWQYKVIEEKKTGKFLTSKERYDQIKNALNSGKYDVVIHAGDPDQEGELLVNLVLNDIGWNKPVLRFWTNDLTESHILNALKNLKDDRTDTMLTNLLAAAYSRQHWDYIFGMNISEAASLQMNGRAAVGRVKTVLLNIIVQREKEIAEFKPVTVYGVKANYDRGFDGNLFNSLAAKDEEYASPDEKAGIIWFKTAAAANEYIEDLGKKAVVKDVIKKHNKIYAPKLYKLSTAQVAAGKAGYDDAKTLSIIQSLYEKRVMSYPRTDCEYLSSDEDFEGILKAVATIPEFTDIVSHITSEDIARVRKNKRWINDKALKDSGHSALRPTTDVPNLEDLSPAEKFIYTMITRRFLAIFLPPMEQDSIEIIAEIMHGPNKATFKSTGKKTTAQGFMSIYNYMPAEKELPAVSKGEVLGVTKYELTEKTTTCPKRFTSPDLIQVCENPAKYLNDKSLKSLGKKLKIGTPATRSGIIKQLIAKDHYIGEKIEGKKVVLVPTESGTKLIKNLNGLMITRVDMTGLWEERLEEVRAGNMTTSTLDFEMRGDFEKMLSEIKNRDMEEIGNHGGAQATEYNCPVCGKPLKKFDWGWACSGYKKDDPRSCQFSVGYHIFNAKNLTENDIIQVLKNGKTSKMRKFHSNKTGKDYTAYLVMDKTGKFSLDFGQEMDDSLKCPICGKPIRKGSKNWYCSGYKEGCHFNVWFNTYGKKMTEKNLKDLIEKGETGVMSGFKYKDGHGTYSANVKLKPDGTTEVVKSDSNSGKSFGNRFGGRRKNKYSLY